MRFTLLFLILADVTVALLEAIPWEVKSWYKAYLIERKVGGSSYLIANGCVHKSWTTNADFDEIAKDLGIEGACTFDEFIKHIGFPNSFGRWEIQRPAVFEYDPNDGLKMLRKMRAAGSQKPLICVWKLIDHHKFPEIAGKTEFDMAKLQDVIGKRVQNLRAEAAKDPVKGAQVEKWVLNRIEDLEVVNQWRDSDQAKFKLDWIQANSKYGPKNKYPLLTSDEEVTLKDGSHPAVSDWPDDKHLEKYVGPDWVKTYAQGGNSALARANVKENDRIMRTYGHWPIDDKEDPEVQKQKRKTNTHVNILETNEKIIRLHEKPPVPVCLGKRASRRYSPLDTSYLAPQTAHAVIEL